MKENEFIKKISEEVKEILTHSSVQSAAHKWDHAWRVCGRATRMAKMLKSENIDIEALKISALLHDIDEPYNKKEDHVETSLRKAEQLLRKVNYPEKKTEKVLTIISEHSLEGSKIPSSIEAKILFDADKLEGSGAIGISRVFIFCGQNGLTPAEAIEWYKKEIEKARPRMQTEIGKSIAKEEFKYVNSFFEKFKKEEQELV